MRSLLEVGRRAGQGSCLSRVDTRAGASTWTGDLGGLWDNFRRVRGCVEAVTQELDRDQSFWTQSAWSSRAPDLGLGAEPERRVSERDAPGRLPQCREEASVLQAPCLGVPTRQVRDPLGGPPGSPCPQPAGW